MLPRSDKSDQPHNGRLKAASAKALRIALSSSAKAPEWVMLLPAGIIETNDGRWYNNDKPDEVVEAFTHGGLELPFDFEHGSEIKAPFGEFSPAAGWITGLENRDGAIWAKVTWTEKGRAAIEAREVKYVSPAFQYSPEGFHVLCLSSAALVVKPAISTLPALNSSQPRKDETHMDKKALCAALGLAETASDQDILAAIVKNKTELATALASAQAPTLDKFVPRSDYDVVAQERDGLKTAMATRDADLLKAEAETAIASAIKEGKIAPASKDYHLGVCSSREGLDKFKAFASAAPTQVSTKAGSEPDANAPATALTSAQKKVAVSLGLTLAEYQAQLEADKKEGEA